MAELSGDAESIRSAASKLNAVHRSVSSTGSGVRGAARAVRGNKTLADLGYDHAIEDVASVLKDYSEDASAYAKALLLVAESFEKGESQAVSKIEGASEGELSKFLTGDKANEGSYWESIKKRNSGFLFGVGATGAAQGQVGHWSTKFEPSVGFGWGKGKNQFTGEQDDGSYNAYAGVKASAEGSVLRGTLEGDWGYAHGNLEGNVLTGAVEGSAGVSFIRDGKFDPELQVGAKAKVSVVGIKGEGRVGSESYNLHVNGSGELLTAEAEGKAYIGKRGVGLEGSAGAYLAKGEVSGGATILGIKVDAKAKGYAGGAGAEGGIGFDWEKKTASGKIGAGLGLGGGVEVNIDFSGIAKGVEDTKKWWDGLWK